MRIFIDSANILEIQKYLNWGVCDGVTTNPTICLKNGVKGGMNGVLKRTEEIAALICPRPVSVEVTSEVPNEIIEQAKQYKKLGENIVVKVTITDSKGNSFLPIIRELVEKEIQVNVTAMMTFNQMVLATQCIASAKKKGEHFVSIFGGRISEEHGIDHAKNVIQDVGMWMRAEKISGISIIVGSIRSSENVDTFIKSGAHVITVPPDVLGKCLRNDRTMTTVNQFIQDAQLSLQSLNS